MCLGFSVLVTRGIHPAIAASNSSKATSPLIFMATWGFCPSLAPASKPQKQQVPSISCLLGAFCSSNMKNSFCYHISEFFKSNKSPYFHGYLGLLPFPSTCFKTAKATSSLDFMPTWGFLLFQHEEFFLLSHLRILQKQQVPAFSWLLGAFALP